MTNQELIDLIIDNDKKQDYDDSLFYVLTEYQPHDSNDLKNIPILEQVPFQFKFVDSGYMGERGDADQRFVIYCVVDKNTNNEQLLRINYWYSSYDSGEIDDVYFCTAVPRQVVVVDYNRIK